MTPRRRRNESGDDGGHAVDLCAHCGERHERRTKGNRYAATCSAHRADGTACMRYPLAGTHVCPFHGVNATTRAAAQASLEREMVARRAAAVLADIQPEPLHADPLKGLLWEVAMSAQAVEWYAERLAELEVPVPNGIGEWAETEFQHVDRLNRPIRRQEPAVLWGHNHDGDQSAHILLTLWNEERERHARLCERAIRAGVIERMGAVADAHATQIAAVIGYVVEALGLPAEQRETAKQLAAGKLRQMRPVLPALSRPAG